MAGIEDRPFDVPAAVARLRTLIDRHCLGPSTACIVDAADDRDIPTSACSRATWCSSATARATHLDRRDRPHQRHRRGHLARQGPDQGTAVHLRRASAGRPPGRQPRDAWDAAEDIGLPVVVKPYDGNHGRGVFTNLTTREEVLSAYAVAVEEGSGVIVERFVLGNEHRLLVVGDRMVAAAAGERPGSRATASLPSPS